MKKVYYFLSVLLIVACGTSENSGENANEVVEVATTAEEEQTLAEIERDKLYQNAIAIHDEIMPKMGEIMSLKSQLQQKLDNLPEATDVSMAAQYEETIEALGNEHDAMMNWMRNDLKKVADTVSQDEAVAYYNQITKRIAKIKENSLSAIEKANELLGQ